MVSHRRTRALCILLAWSPFALQSAGAQTPEEIFRRGNAAYENGRMEEAVEAYETVLKYRVQDARVEYNLGNALFRLGRLGPAILHFERARRLDPIDGDVLANLEYARSFCADRVEPAPLPPLLALVVRLQNGLGPDRQAWAAVLWVWLTALLLAWIFSRPGRWRAVHGWLLAGMLLLLVATAGSWHMTWQRLQGARQAVVLVEAAEVLAGPGENNPTLFTVHEGLTLRVRGARQDWLQVSLPNGLNGWIPLGAVGLVE